MKISNYNVIHELDGKYYVLNLISRGLIEVTDKYVKDVLIGEELLDTSFLKEEDFNILKRGGFLIADYLDELDILKLRFRKQKYNGEKLFLTIIPTYSCNFKCTYCYQNQISNIGGDYCDGIISSELLDSLEVYLKGATTNKKHLHVEWFGGEPTLVSDLVIDFNYKIKSICEDNDCNFTSSIVSNGYLLDEDMSRRFLNSGIDSVLLTIDGPKNIHDKRRILKNNKGTFDIIINNLTHISKYLNINLRINIDNQNIDHIYEFIDFLDSLMINKSNINIIIVSTIIDEEFVKGLSSVNSESMINFYKEILDKIISSGFKCRIDNLLNRYICSAKISNKFIIDMNGSINKCSALSGYYETSDGKLNLETNQFEMNHNWMKWENWEPFDDEDCSICKFLPLCYGGCILNKVSDNYDIENKHLIKAVENKNKNCRELYRKFVELFMEQNIECPEGVYNE